MERYSLEELSKTFVKHADEVERQREEMIIRWKNEYHSDKIPEHMQDTFNLPSALLFMVQEVDRLRREVEELREMLDPEDY